MSWLLRSPIFKLCVSVIALTIIISNLDFSNAVATLKNAKLLLAIVVGLLLLADRIFMAWKWYLLARVQYPELTVAESIRTYLLGSFLGTAVPLGGLGPDVVRMTLLLESGVEKGVALSSIVLERLIGLVATIIVLAASVMCTIAYVMHLDAGRTDLLLSLGVLLMAAIAALAAATFVPRIWRILGLNGEDVRFRRYTQALSQFSGRQDVLWKNLALAVVEQLFPVITFLVACHAFDVTMSLFASFCIVPFASVLMRLPLSFAGLGMREIGLITMGSIFGLGYDQAVVVGLAQFVIFILVLAPSVLLLFFKKE